MVRISLTGGRWRPATVALNKSPALVLSGNESTEDSSPLLLIDFLRPSFISLNVTLCCNDFDEDAGDTLVDLPLSALGDNPTRFSGFCKGRFNMGTENELLLLEKSTFYLCFAKTESKMSVKKSSLILIMNV